MKSLILWIPSTKGVRTLITEKEATIIKNIVEKSGRNDLDNVVQLKNVSTEMVAVWQEIIKHKQNTIIIIKNLTLL